MKGQSRKYIFLIIQFILYGAFLTLDILERDIALSNRIKFAVVVLCFIYVLASRMKNRSREHTYLIYALAFTVVSDIFILLSDYYLIGLLTFILAQQLYGVRITLLINRERDANSPISLYRDFIIRLLYQGAFALLLGIILWLSDENLDALLAASIFYFICICTNVVRILKLSVNHHDKKDIIYFAIGMVLFLLCDINVGLFNLSGFINVTPAYDVIYKASTILMWTFYAPSQVLIALSSD
ncbi:MAG: hypothetical protein GX129_10395 [Clostridiales bacterium]|jgi:hypothetical protein|nr:hypothetical protein [Clostridiales bacterium]